MEQPMICQVENKNKQQDDLKDIDDLKTIAPMVSEDIICIARNIFGSSLKEENLLAILDNLPYGLFTTDGEHKITYFNAAAELITGLPVSQALGKPCREAFNSDICANNCTLDKLNCTENNIYIREFEIKKPDGKSIPIICTTSSLTNQDGSVKQIMYVFRDILDRKRLEYDLKLSENRYQRIFEGSKDMIFVTSKEGKVKDANQACLDLLEYGSKYELMLMGSVEEVFNNAMHWRVFREQIDRHGFIKDFEACFRKKDGTNIHCLMSGNAVRGERGEIVGYEAIAKDITARMHGLRSLQRQHRKLSLLNSIAVAMNVSQDLNDILMVALKKLLDVLGLKGGGIFLIDHGKRGFSLKVQQSLLGKLGGNSCHVLLYDVALMRSLLKGNLSLKPQGTFPPFKATLVGTNNWNALELTCYLITRKEKASGFIGLEVPQGKKIGDEDHRILGSLGNFLGSAIENSLLLQTVQQHREELQRLTARLFHSQDEDRKRIARELHDEAGQALTGINFSLETIIKSLPGELESVKGQILDIKKQINHTYQEMRRMSHRLHPAVLSDLGLEPALESYLSDISTYSGLDIEFRMVGFEKRLDAETETVLYRIAKEVVTNTLKHSGAELFKLSIVKSYPHIIFLAEDDGVGFDPSKLENRRDALGLLGVRERVALIGGSFSIRSSRAEGTKIRIEIPVKELPDE
jgi:PAS domain S-box-containing protein